jgi:hypothetical protein
MCYGRSDWSCVDGKGWIVRGLWFKAGGARFYSCFASGVVLKSVSQSVPFDFNSAKPHAFSMFILTGPVRPAITPGPVCMVEFVL